MRRAILIPVRLESSRLPRKPLLARTGRPLVQHVWEAARDAAVADLVAIATDSEEIRATARGFGAEVFLTRDDHRCGTDRIAEVVERELRPAGCELVLNLQGDEPEIPPAALGQLFETLERDGEACMSTLACPIRSDAELRDPDVVKVVLDRRGRALYFSRAPIPAAREPGAAQPLRHVGIYGYRSDYLLELAARAPTPLERCESLEQLRALESGDPVGVTTIEWIPRGIDTPGDYEAFVERCLAGAPPPAPSITPISRGGD